MKFKLLVKDRDKPDSAAWEERFDEDVPGSLEGHAEAMIERFNRTLKSGEVARTLVGVVREETTMSECCESQRLCTISCKCSDLFNAEIEGNEHDGYVPPDLGIGGGDYVKMVYCLNCGQIQGEWPLPETELEQGRIDDEPPDSDTCGECDGTGECSACDNSGELDGETCDNCDGSGDCPECGGSGEVPV